MEMRQNNLNSVKECDKVYERRIYHADPGGL